MPRKQIAFDLDTKALKKYYPSDSWQNAYDVIKRHMKKNNFIWLQGSVYVSEKSMTVHNVSNILKDLVAKNPWLNLCMRDCRETDLGKEHDKNYIFDKNANIPTREEMKASQEQKSAADEWKEPTAKEHHVRDKQMSLSDYKKLISEERAAGSAPAEPRSKQRNNDTRSGR